MKRFGALATGAVLLAVVSAAGGASGEATGARVDDVNATSDRTDRGHATEPCGWSTATAARSPCSTPAPVVRWRRS